MNSKLSGSPLLFIRMNIEQNECHGGQQNEHPTGILDWCLSEADQRLHEPHYLTSWDATGFTPLGHFQSTPSLPHLFRLTPNLAFLKHNAFLSQNLFFSAILSAAILESELSKTENKKEEAIWDILQHLCEFPMVALGAVAQSEKHWSRLMSSGEYGRFLLIFSCDYLADLNKSFIII